jgi:1,5-anhydro-D-fructose reductase (1,5-anhydro-D-mannitol-forming)
MRWGLVGTGRHAEERIAPALRAAEGHSLRGVVGSGFAKARDFAERHGAVAHPSLDALLADGAIDAVFIATPNDRHRDETIRAAAAGKHVLVEKPMALSVGDCAEMIAACERAGVALGVGFQQRHAPVHVELRRLIATGALGEPVVLGGEWHTAYPPWTNWRADRARAGADVLAAVGVHVLDLLCHLAGAEVADVAAVVDVDAGTGLDRTVAASLRFEGGAVATMTATRRARAPRNSVSVLGTRGTACGLGTLGMDPTGRLETVIDGRAEARDLPVVDLYRAQFEAFAGAVARGEPPSAGGWDGLRSVALTERVLAAARRA